jgi:hypothetical protein
MVVMAKKADTGIDWLIQYQRMTLAGSPSRRVIVFATKDSAYPFTVHGILLPPLRGHAFDWTGSSWTPSGGLLCGASTPGNSVCCATLRDGACPEGHELPHADDGSW